MTNQRINDDDSIWKHRNYYISLSTNSVWFSFSYTFRRWVNDKLVLPFVPKRGREMFYFKVRFINKKRLIDCKPLGLVTIILLNTRYETSFFVRTSLIRAERVRMFRKQIWSWKTSCVSPLFHVPSPNSSSVLQVFLTTFDQALESMGKNLQW